MNTETGYIRLPRRILDGEIASKPQALAVFVHILVRANREPKTWHGVRINRGQFVTSRRSLSKSCGLSEHQVRTALQILTRQGLAQVFAQVHAHHNDGGAAHLAAQGYTIVTICNYDSYEGAADKPRPSFRPSQNSDAAQVSTQKAATTKEKRSISKDIESSIVESIVDIPEFRPIVLDWMEYKRERGQAYKGQKGLSQFYNRLRELSGGDPDTARRIVSEAMAANYATIYPLKAPRPAAASPTTRARTEIPEYEQNKFKDNYKSTLL